MSGSRAMGRDPARARAAGGIRARVLGLVLVLSLAPGAGRVGEPDRREVQPDRVLLRDGRERSGTVVRLDDEVLALRQGQRIVELPLAEVESYRAALVELPRALARIAALPAGDVDALLAEAATLAQRNLPLEADLLHWRVLTLAPDNALAHQALGHVRRGAQFLLPLDGRRVPLERVLEERRSWEHAWQLPTTHHDLVTDLELPLALDGALLLEDAHLAFQELLGDELGLLPPEQPLRVELRAGEEPSGADPREPRSRWERDGARLVLDGSRGLRVGEFMRELVRARLERASRSGPLPAWLVEGLACYAEAAVERAPGGTEVDPRRPNARLFATHGLAAEPLPLGRILALRGDELRSSLRAGPEVAQAYTLVHFCLHAGEGRLRAPFVEHVRGLLEGGPAGESDLPRALGATPEELEQAWHAYAAASTGRR